MTRQHFIKKSYINAPIEEVFAWHKSPEAIRWLTPPSKRMKVVRRTGGIEDEGSELEFKIFLFGPLYITWLAKHHQYVENEQFQDIQIKGPFAHWEHTHRFIKDNDGSGFWMEDDITYELPMGLLGHLVMGAFIRQDIEDMFEHRHNVLHEQFKA